MRQVGLMAILAAAGVLAGCEPVKPALFDAEALRSARRLVVLPLADAPGPEGARSGRIGGGAAMAELVKMGSYRVIDLPPDELKAALAKTGYGLADRYDPAVAAAVAKTLGADAAVAGEITHYGTQKEQTAATVTYVSSSKTVTTHWVSLSLRIVRADDARIIYTGTGTASAKESYSPACDAACAQALAALKHLLKKPK